MRTTTTTARRAARLGLAAALALGTASLAACSDDEGDDATAGTDAPGATAPAEDAGEEVERFNAPTAPVEVTVGQTFQIAYVADEEEGYTWSLVDAGDSSVVELQESQPNALPGESEGDLTDVGSDVFLFHAVGEGETELSFSQGAEFPTTTIVDQATVTVIVTG